MKFLLGKNFRLSQTDEQPYFIKDTIWEEWELIMNREKTFSWVK